MSLPLSLLRSLLAAPLLAACIAAAQAQPLAAASAPQDFSRAEKLLFMADQLGPVKRPATLRYKFSKSGSLEPGFDDQVQLKVGNDAKGQCCAASVAFLSGERRFVLPEVEMPQANPVTLHFLERDVREMQRITKGRSGYYQKRIRMAVYQGATVTEASVSYRGKPITVQRIEIDPFADDPARGRYEKFARKTYRFELSDAVPGGVYSLRSVMLDADDKAPPLVVEDLRIDGAEPAPSAKP